MFKIILSLLLMTMPALSAEQWTVAKPASTDNPVNWPTGSLANNDSLDRLLANFRSGMTLTYVNASSLSVTAGSATCNNAGVHSFRQNTAATTINTSNLDSGSSFSASTTFYVYANCSADATTATFTISLNSSTPASVTSYLKIGSFGTDSSSNILQASVNQEPSGYLTADANGNKSVQGIFNYGSSLSVFTYVTGNLKIAYGTTGTITWGTCSTISNLPFISASSYIALASADSGNSSQNACSINAQAASTMSVCAVSVPAGGNINVACNWIAMGT